MILLSRLWCSSLATLRPVHSTATEVARHRTMPRQHSTLNTERYHEWLKPQSYRGRESVVECLIHPFEQGGAPVTPFALTVIIRIIKLRGWLMISSLMCQRGLKADMAGL